jgi:hypothetical protein
MKAFIVESLLPWGDASRRTVFAEFVELRVVASLH